MVGGQAISALGVPRQTSDLEIVARGAEVDTWRSVLKQPEYVLTRGGGAFLECQPNGLQAYRLFVIFVGDETFERMKESAQVVQFGGEKAIIPSTEHLIAMRLYALRFMPGDRTQLDMGDILNLVDHAGLRMDDDEFRNLCIKYGDLGLYERLMKIREESNWH